MTAFNPMNIGSPAKWGIKSQKHIDIGCGAKPRNPFGAGYVIGADLLTESFLPQGLMDQYLQLKIGEPIPLPDTSVDSISGYDFLEHLSRDFYPFGNLFISFMNEAHRILKPGGMLFCVTPAYPSPAAFQDPTHVNFISEETVNYFIGEAPHAKSLGYGFEGSFSLVYQGWVGPFSNIFLDNSESSVVNTSRAIMSISKLRSIISTYRKPTHLVWLLQKNNVS